MLAQLPTELLHIILDHLAIPDYISLRLTSRHLEQASTPAFSTAFSELRLDLSKPNLAWLSDIASHPSLRLAVREWRIGHWEGRGGADRLSHEVPLSGGTHWPRLSGGGLDLASSPATLVASLLSRFPNCTGATITDERDRDMGTGLSLSLDGDVSVEKGLFPRDAVALVLHAFASPSAPPLRRLRTLMAGNLDAQDLGTIERSTIASVRGNVAAHLRELALQFRPRDDDFLARVLELLTSAPGLRTLRLMWIGSQGMTPPGVVLARHLEALPNFRPPLETLGLAGISLGEDDLLRLLSACQDTLRTLDLYDVMLRSGSWATVLEHLHAAPFPNLGRLSMVRCAHFPGGEGMMDFCPLRVDRELQASCGGTFEFGKHKIRAGPRRYAHVMGVLFEAGPGPSDMKLALRACIDRSRRYPLLPGANLPRCTCGKASALPKLPAAPLIFPPEVFDKSPGSCERWTGLPRAMR